MKRISGLLLGLLVISWVTGCCTHSRMCGWHAGDGCGRAPRGLRSRLGMHEHSGPCGCEGYGDVYDGGYGYGPGPEFQGTAYGPQGGGNCGCSGGGQYPHAMGGDFGGQFPMSQQGGGCASGNCGGTIPGGTTSSMPMSYNGGWTISNGVSTNIPLSNEGVPAPPANASQPTPIVPPAR